MTIYRVVFDAKVTREVEVPEGLDWSEAYDFVCHKLGWHEIAHAPAARLSIDTDKVVGFEKVRK